MDQATTIGLDIAKHVFQVHGADAAGHVRYRAARARRRCCRSPIGRPRRSASASPKLADSSSAPEKWGVLVAAPVTVPALCVAGASPSALELSVPVGAFDPEAALRGSVNGKPGSAGRLTLRPRRDSVRRSSHSLA